MQSSGISSPATFPTGRSPAEQPRSRHALIGRSKAIDRRTAAVRADLTDVRLAAAVFAPHYAAAMAQTALSILPIRAGADAGSAILSELLPGDTFEMLELSQDIAWGIGTTDGVVGYVDARGLGDFAAPTHRIVAIAAPLREAPNTHASVLATLPMGARIAALGERDAFLLTDHGYVTAADLAPLGARTGDPAGIAAGLVGVAASAGGRSGAGVDAAGLIFLACDACGLAAPRFADLQASDLGTPLAQGDSGRAGDAWFFDRHAAILLDGDMAVHVADRVARIACRTLLSGDFGPVTARRRIA